MSGAACTSSDMKLLAGLLSSPPWTNCSSITSAAMVKSLYLEQKGTKTACEIPTCAANLIAVQAQMPNCLIANSNNSIKAFQAVLGCVLPTNAASTTLLSGLTMVVAVLLVGA
ncbi:hypothetical protein SPRG_13643 [Saprolegnia parasitica CBS 223.65]|uniref:Elicitin n=1 Tax=Saprolegnia parasitica (strain CBS 223.65) TaxID=695850 RepID=A0A067BRE8_SAPPC|nr:hypothetical protein SPRG_13643 [Saprolegnia parasitica CBS 223.65]KDO20828.1 hypothetical protein SPRG_13643 [Saprolegnia parasitica CBS 223.65]|eukprot:XP_012208486.1 hypothetical protein SPRG_13643 [Saprolegnia parasitica CBS 223.65]